MSSEHYETVTYWYGLPATSLILTDEIDIGSPDSEKAHAYISPGASEVEIISSRYELGIDRFPEKVWGMDAEKISGYAEKRGKEIFTEQTQDGRHTRGASEFSVKINPQNLGVLLRRTLDYSYPNQKAEVYIADTSANSKWELAGTWYLAGSNTSLYSDPKGELDKRLYNVQTSNRRFRDDEFLISPKRTANRSVIRIRMKFVSDIESELYPDYRFPKASEWSELKYSVYSYIVPEFTMK